MKRAGSGGSDPSSKKRKVTFTTYKKWASEFDNDFKTLTWLDCETTYDDGKKIVSQLKCSICAKFQKVQD